MGKLLKGNKLDVPKRVKKYNDIHTTERKEKKTIPETLISNQEKQIKEEPIHKKNI